MTDVQTILSKQDAMNSSIKLISEAETSKQLDELYCNVIQYHDWLRDEEKKGNITFDVPYDIFIHTLRKICNFNLVRIASKMRDEAEQNPLFKSQYKMQVALCKESIKETETSQNEIDLINTIFTLI